MKLFKIILQGFHEPFYVAAEDSEKAYQKIRKDFDKRDYGMQTDRILKSAELIAHDAEYPENKVRFYQ